VRGGVDVGLRTARTVGRQESRYQDQTHRFG